VKRLAAAALSLMACAARPPAPPPVAPAAPNPPAAAAPAAAPIPRAATEERLAAIERCKQGYANLDAVAHVDPPALVAELARGCADIYVEPCAAAMRSAPADPDQFASTAARACRDAYCPRLPAPRPRLCERGALPPQAELLGEWGELHQQILARELGLPPETLAPLFQPVTALAVRDVAREGPAPVHVYARPEGGSRMRVWLEGGGGITVDLYGGSKPLATLAHTARAKAAPDAQVIFACDRRLPYGAVVSILDAFKKEGFARIALSVRPELTR
jgi:hypothetical protein